MFGTYGLLLFKVTSKIDSPRRFHLSSHGLFGIGLILYPETDESQSFIFADLIICERYGIPALFDKSAAGIIEF